MSGGGEAGEGRFHGLVTGEVADVVAVARHLVGIDLGLGREPGNETAGGIGTTTAINAFFDEMAVFFCIVIEGRYAPMALGGTATVRSSYSQKAEHPILCVC